MFFNLTDVKGDVHEVYSLLFVSKGLMTRSGLQPSLLRVDLWS